MRTKFNQKLRKNYGLIGILNLTERKNLYNKGKLPFYQILQAYKSQITKFNSYENARKFEINFIKDFLLKEKNYTNEEVKHFPIKVHNNYLIINQPKFEVFEEYLEFVKREN